LLLLGENPKVVQERLGHAQVEMTLEIYSHLLPGMQRAAADRLDDLLRNDGPAKPDGDPSTAATSTKGGPVREIGSGRHAAEAIDTAARDVIVPFRRRAQ